MHVSRRAVGAVVMMYAALARVRLLCIESLDRERFWRKAADAMEEAARRPDQKARTTAFLLRLHDWLVDQEEDRFVLAAVRPTIPDGSHHTLRVLCKRASGAAMSPGPVDPELARFLGALVRHVSKKLDTTPDLLEWLVSRSVLSRATEAHALLCFRRGDTERLASDVDATQRLIELDEAQSRWWDANKVRYEAENWLLNMGLQGALGPLADLGKLREKGVEEWMKEFQDAGKRVVEDQKIRDEAWRRIEEDAEHILRVRREDLARERPWIGEMSDDLTADPFGINCLSALLRDAAFLRSGAFPDERLDELLDRSLASWSGEDHKRRQWGRDVYLWAVREALLRPESAPGDAVRDRLESPSPEEAGILVSLKARGEKIDQSWLDDVLKAAFEDHWPLRLHPYCVVLAERARADSAAALAMLPSDATALTPDCESMIAQTLRAATGEDHGVVLSGWRDHLRRGN